jgi:hypothetical protein
MTQDERQGTVLGADVGAAVGMADAGRDDAHEHLVRADLRYVDVLLHQRSVELLQDGRTHQIFSSGGPGDGGTQRLHRDTIDGCSAVDAATVDIIP